MNPARKRMRLKDGSSSSEGKLLEPTATLNALPSEVMKNIFSFVGKGSYCFIGPVSKDFCLNYLTMDVIEDKFAHRMDYLQAIGKNRITTAEAASFSFDLAEYCFFKAPEDFQKELFRQAVRTGRIDIVTFGHAMGINVKESIRFAEGDVEEMVRKGGLEMLKFFRELRHDFQSWMGAIIAAAMGNGQLDILNWLHELMKMNPNPAGFITMKFSMAAVMKGNVKSIKWAKSTFGCDFQHPCYLFYLKKAASSGSIEVLEYLIENGCPHEDPATCSSAVKIHDHEKALEVLQWLHQNGIPWDESTCAAAAEKGNLNALKYLRANDCPWNENSLIEAVRYHHLEVIKYCLTNACPLGETNICSIAMSNLWVRNDHDQGLRILKLLREFSVPWGTGTCEEAANAENFEGLKWAVSQACPWNRQTCAQHAAEHGNIEILKWLSKEGCQWNAEFCARASLKGHLKTLKWLRSVECPWNEQTFLNAFISGNIAVVEYCINNHDFRFDDRMYEYAIENFPDPIYIIKLLRKSGYPWHRKACTKAAARGDIKLLRWLRFLGCAWDESVCNEAVRQNNFEILKYAHENGCVWSKATYAYCYDSIDGLDGQYIKVPTMFESSDDIVEYLNAHNCPKPDRSDWNIIEDLNFY